MMFCILKIKIDYLEFRRINFKMPGGKPVFKVRNNFICINFSLESSFVCVPYGNVISILTEVTVSSRGYIEVIDKQGVERIEHCSLRGACFQVNEVSAEVLAVNLDLWLESKEEKSL